VGTAVRSDAAANFFGDTKAYLLGPA